VELKKIILEVMAEVADMTQNQLVDSLSDDTILLQSGLDSLGFAILVSRLEEVLGYDPFVLMDSPVYPRTLGQFVAIYEQYA